MEDATTDAIRLDWELFTLHKQCIAKLLTDLNIHFGQPPLLFTLKNMGACKQSDLAKALRVSPATIAVSLKRMEKSGFIKRISNPNDLRSNRIELTEAGINAADSAEKIIHTVIAQKFDGFTEEEYAQLMHFFHRMHQNLLDYKNKLDGTEDSI
ncbi:MarR family transcriptional regulator [Oscillospiraceae bacterium PP1C4]